MNTSAPGEQDDILLHWILSREDLSPEALRDVLKRWREGKQSAPLATVLLEAGRATPEQITQVLSTHKTPPSSASRSSDSAPASSTRIRARLPEKAREALDTPSNWFGPVLSNGLPKYLLVRPLGEGGMGQVFQAYQLDLERWVALKFLKENDPADRQRFLREARASGALSHSNIVRVYEVGEWEGRCYLAMEYIQGNNLLKAELSLRRACELVRDAARAVHYANSEGIIHRDLKPQNLLLSDGGRLVVVDFGLARIVNPGSTASLTVSGQILGTPAFMAPEQARGAQREIDGRTDVYGLGATLYHLLTGRPPFQGENMWEIVSHVVQRDPEPPQRINAKIDRDLDVIVTKCLEKDRDRRYESGEALAKDLDRYLAGEAIEARPPSLAYRVATRIRRAPLLSGALAVILLLALAAGGLIVRSRLAGAREEQAQRELRCQQIFAILRPFLDGETLPEMGLDLSPFRRTPLKPRGDAVNETLADEAVGKATRTSTRFEALHYRAQLHLLAGEHGKARDALERAGSLAVGFKPPGFYLYRGYARERTGDVEGAIADYRELPLAPKRPRFTALVRAGDLRRKAGRPEDARALYDLAAEVSPEPLDLNQLDLLRKSLGP